MALRFRIPLLSLRVKLVVLAVMGVLLVLQPIAESRQDLTWLRTGPDRYHEVPLACSTDPADPSESATQYLEHRPARIDRLLPKGEGGTRFFASLDGYAGMAFAASASVGLAVDAGLNSSRGMVEIHELAHLAQFFLAHEAAALMRDMPRPARGEYAATNAGEHFAEMAAVAWQVVELADPVDFCVDGDPADWLRDAEARVPGTAGFVAWYLRQFTPADTDVAASLRMEADRLIAPKRQAWNRIYAALEARRLPDGRFRPWQPPSLVEYLETSRVDARMAGGFLGHVRAAQVTASLALVRTAEWVR